MTVRTDPEPVVDFVVLSPRAPERRLSQSGKVRPAVLLWALGVPIPLILLVLLLRSCM